MPNVPLSEATKNGFVAAATKIAQVNDAATSAGLTAAQARTDVVTVKSDVTSIKASLLTAQGDVSLVKNDVSALKLDNSSLAQRLAALPVMEPDTTDFAALIQAPAGGATGASSTPGFVLVPAGQPAPTDLPDGVIVVMEDPTGGTAV